MKASVIIITKNQKELLEKSLPILLNQNLKGKYEIIVVDSGSTDGAVEYLQTLPIKLIKIRPKRFNYASAFNTGARASSGEFLIRLSGDVIPKKTNFISQLIKPFKNPKVGGVYGRYTLSGRPGFTYPPFWPKERFPAKETTYSVKPNLIKMLLNKKHQEVVLNFAGGCSAIRRRTWRYRHFNERLIAAEDAEYSLYLHLRNFNIVCNPEAETVHEHKAIGSRNGILTDIKWRIPLILESIKLFL